MPDFEIVIIDDGSQDSTSDLIAQWRARDARIRIIRNDVNRGVAFSLNRGLSECSAGLIARMDADDRMFHDRIEVQARYMKDNPGVHILGSWAEIIDSTGKPTSIRRMPVEHRDILNVIWACPLMHPTVMYRRDAILALGGYSEEAHQREDYDLWFRCAEVGLKFHNIPEPLIQYRHDHESFARYDMRTALRQFRIGLRGCWRLKTGLRSYAALFVPLIRSAFPVGLRKKLHGITKHFDPRGT